MTTFYNSPLFFPFSFSPDKMSTCLHTAPGYYYYYCTNQHPHRYHYNKPTTSFIHHVKPSSYMQQSLSSSPTLDEQIHESSIAMIESEQLIFGTRSQSPVVCIPRLGVRYDDKLQKHISTREHLALVIGAVSCVGNCESRATRHVHDPLETITRHELWDDVLNNRYMDTRNYVMNCVILITCTLSHSSNNLDNATTLANNEISPNSASSSTDISQCSTADGTELSSMVSTTKNEPSSK